MCKTDVFIANKYWSSGWYLSDRRPWCLPYCHWTMVSQRTLLKLLKPGFKLLHKQNKAFTRSVSGLSSRGHCGEFSMSLYTCSVYAAILMREFIWLCWELSERWWHFFFPRVLYTLCLGPLYMRLCMPQVPLLFYKCAHFVCLESIFRCVRSRWSLNIDLFYQKRNCVRVQFISYRWTPDFTCMAIELRPQGFCICGRHGT